MTPATKRPASRRFFIETWGCQMNELDSQRMVGQLQQQGLLPARRPEEADLILLNSCSVREKAQHKVYSRLGEFQELKQQKGDLRIGLCGCVAQQEGERALQRLSYLDFVMGPARVGELTSILAELDRGQRVVATGFPEERRFDIDTVAQDGAYKGMVTVIEGCNKKCTFCIVPSTRGPERSRPLRDILEDVRYLVDYGFVEIELLGQTVNHWRDPGSELDFADLLHAVATTPGVERLRFVTSYPRDFTPRMVEQIGLHETICPYLHLPVQSGSDRILRRMGRGYTIDSYLQLVEDLRRARPGLAISTDLIVGFPGESEDDFAATVALLQEVRFAALFAFCFSPRPGTAAPKLDGQVETALAQKRLQDLFAVQNAIQLQLNEELVDRELGILVTGSGKEAGSFVGRTTCHRIVHLKSPEDLRPGQIVQVRIEKALSHCLFAVLCSSISAPATHPSPPVRPLFPILS